MGRITENFRRIRAELPPEVRIVAAAKSRTCEEIAEVVEAGAGLIGENYVQEAEATARGLPQRLLNDVRFHMIGHLQRNKLNRALALFDTVQSLDSMRLAVAIDRRLAGAAPMPALVQVNVAGEETKHGISPEELHVFLRQAAALDKIRIKGLMAMEPYCRNPEHARPYFKKMRRLFETAAETEGVEMKILSMGMSHSYKIAVEEGTNMVRIGSAIFGPR